MSKLAVFQFQEKMDVSLDVTSGKTVDLQSQQQEMCSRDGESKHIAASASYAEQSEKFTGESDVVDADSRVNEGLEDAAVLRSPEKDRLVSSVACKEVAADTEIEEKMNFVDGVLHVVNKSEDCRVYEENETSVENARFVVQAVASVTPQTGQSAELLGTEENLGSGAHDDECITAGRITDESGEAYLDHDAKYLLKNGRLDYVPQAATSSSCEEVCEMDVAGNVEGVPEDGPTAGAQATDGTQTNVGVRSGSQTVDSQADDSLMGGSVVATSQVRACDWSNDAPLECSAVPSMLDMSQSSACDADANESLCVTEADGQTMAASNDEPNSSDAFVDLSEQVRTSNDHSVVESIINDGESLQASILLAEQPEIDDEKSGGVGRKEAEESVARAAETYETPPPKVQSPHNYERTEDVEPVESSASNEQQTAVTVWEETTNGTSHDGLTVGPASNVELKSASLSAEHSDDVLPPTGGCLQSSAGNVTNIGESTTPAAGAVGKIVNRAIPQVSICATSF
jgi:hypothetical protein